MWAAAVRIHVRPNLAFPTFWVLDKPADHNISGRRCLKIEAGEPVDAGSWADDADAVFCRDTEKSTSIRVRPGGDGAVLSYSLTPKKVVLALPVAAIAMLSLLAASLVEGPHLGSIDLLRPIADAVALHEVPLLLFIVVSSLVVPRFIDDAYLRGGL